MISWIAVVGVSVIALGIVLTPGPNMVHLVSHSVSQGTRAGLISLAGNAFGFVCFLVAATLGLAAFGAMWQQLLLLGGVQIAISVSVHGLIVFTAGRLAGFLRRRPLAMRIQRWIFGAVLGGFALKLAFERQPVR